MSELNSRKNNLNNKKMNVYKSILDKEYDRILNKIIYLNSKYNLTNSKYEKKVIGQEIDILELELEKVKNYLMNNFFDKKIMLENIKNKKGEIFELEHLINNKEIPSKFNINLINKKLDLNNFISESILRMNKKSNDFFGQPSVIEVPKIVEVEKFIEVPKVIEVVKNVEVPKIVEVEKFIEVEKLVQFDKVVEIPKVVEVDKFIEVEKVVEVPTLIGVDKIVEIPKIVEIDTNGNAQTISTEEISSKIDEGISKLAGDVNNSLNATSEYIHNEINSAKERIDSLEQSLANSPSKVITQTEPVYIETPVLIQTPYQEYYDDYYYDDQYQEEIIEEEPPVVEAVQHVVTEEYYHDNQPQILEVVSTPTPNIEEKNATEVIVEQEPVAQANVEIQKTTPNVVNSQVQQEVYEEVYEDDYFDDDDDFDSSFE